MPAEVIKQINNEFTVQFTVKLTGSMLNDELALQAGLNDAGMAAKVLPLVQTKIC